MGAHRRESCARRPGYLRGLFARCHVLPAPATPEQVVAAVQEVLGKITEGSGVA
jgi:hypothetical protein